ncbi:HipA domain-containing protein [Frateuria aurantia]
MNVRRLLAWIGSEPVGVLQEQQGLWQFSYVPSWSGYGLSPALPVGQAPIMDGASVRPVQWYFDNLLPEEGQRLLMAADARVDQADAMGLLAYYGAESAGALILLPEGELPAAPGAALVPLPDVALSARIQRLPRQPLSHGARKRMSLAGAQHKLAVVLRDGQLYEPQAIEPSTHILKPDHPSPDYAHSVINEWFVMKLAAAVGLQVPAVVRRYVPEPVYLIERFDRQLTAAGTRRLHVIDACQLLGLDRSFKYSSASMAVLAELAELCRLPVMTRQRLFQWQLFNLLVGNGDAHLKNLSFLVGSDGVQLAPHYDLLSTAVYEARAIGGERWPAAAELAWPMQGRRVFADIDPACLLAAAAELGLSRDTAARLLRTMQTRIEREAALLLARVEQDNQQLSALRPALGPGLQGELRCLRAMVHVVIKDMLAQLGTAP